MGLLRASTGGTLHCLGNHALVGRAPECGLRLETKLASSTHALLRWTRAGWVVRDIGSRNGTLLDGTRLDPGRDVPLPVGSQVCFGDRTQPWELVHAGPPGPAAQAHAPSLPPSSGGGPGRGADGIVATDSGLLALPDVEHPLVLVLFDGTRWVVERDDEGVEAHDGMEIAAEGERWTLLLPKTPVHAPVASTLDVSADDLGQVVLCFTVSQDQEHVDLEVHVAGDRHPLSPRNHHFALLALARARAEDARIGLPEPEQGWLYQDDLCRMLGADVALLNLHLFRAREQLAAAGLAFAGRIVERRRLSRQLRLGPVRVEVR